MTKSVVKSLIEVEIFFLINKIVKKIHFLSSIFATSKNIPTFAPQKPWCHSSVGRAKD